MYNNGKYCNKIPFDFRFLSIVNIPKCQNEMFNSLKELSLLNHIKKYIEINIRKYIKVKEKLNPSVQISYFNIYKLINFIWHFLEV